MGSGGSVIKILLSGEECTDIFNEIRCGNYEHESKLVCYSDRGCPLTKSFLIHLKILKGDFVNAEIQASRIIKVIIFMAQKDNDKYCQLNLGIFYQHGIGVKQDYEKSFNYIQLSAQQRYIIAIYELGMCYFNGKGTAVNPTDAFRLLHEAAIQRYPPAENSIGKCYQLGVGVDIHFETALEWYYLYIYCTIVLIL
jgi:hypothetical protein